MHWLKKFRRDYVKKDGTQGIDREVFASMVRRRGVGCSAVLIGIVEGGGITHPNIANKIAIVAQATPEQRDSMVHPDRRGGWNPPKPKRRSEYEKPLPPMALNVIPDNARRVVMIDIAGKEIARFESMSDAAEAVGCSVPTVRNRCCRAVSGGTGEFRFYDCTWRFAQEWDSMSESARIADIENARRSLKKRGNKNDEQALIPG